MTTPIQTVLVAPPAEQHTIQTMLASFGNYQVTRVFQDMAAAELLDYLLVSDTTLVVVHQGVEGFSTKGLQECVHTKGAAARVVAAIVDDQGDVFDACMQTGAVVFRLPFRKGIFERLSAGYPDYYAEAVQRMATSVVVPDAAPELDNTAYQALGVRRQFLQVLTVWSSKGGSGKSMTAMELAYLLANVGGRKVLLVDGDMNRGYVAVALGQDAMAFARQKNIATLATLYHNRAQMPNLESFVYNYSPAFGKGGRGNLDILFGLASPDQANLPCFVGDEGQQGMHFVSALRDMAQKSYEFLIFDIGTLIPVHVHAAAIKEATTLLVVSTPIVPDIQPTKAGLEQMKKYDLLPRNASEKAVLVMNHYHEDCGFQENEFPAFIGLTMVAAFPQVVPEPLMYAIVNQGQFVSEHFLGSKNGDALKGLTRQLLGLAEYFAPGTRGLARQHAPKLADVVETDRRGIFKRKRA